MSGSLLSRSEIVDLVNESALVIDPFDHEKLGLCHYRLTAAQLYAVPGHLATNDAPPLHDVATHGPIYELKPREYVVARIRERLILPTGIVGQLLPVSWLIEHGVGFTGGKIDAHYGHLERTEQPIIVGIQNLLDAPTPLHLSRGVAHVSFVDLRHEVKPEAKFAADQLQQFRERSSRFQRAWDDGPFYPEGD